MRKYSDDVYSFVVSRRMYAKTYTEIGDELREKFGIPANRKIARNIYRSASGECVSRSKYGEDDAGTGEAYVPEHVGWRDYTGYLCGDPPVGRSALDRRMAG